MCGTCGCGGEAARVEGVGGHHHPADHAHSHEHRLPDGTVVRHAHPHAHEHGEDHRHDHHDASEHVHVLPDGTTVRHSHPHLAEDRHEHADDTEHEHVLADGRVLRHRHVAGAAPHRHDPAEPLVTAQEARTARLVRVEQDLFARNDRFAATNRTLLRATRTLCLNVMSSPGAGKTSLLVATIERLKGQCPLAVIEGDQETRLDAERIRGTGVPAIQVNTGKGCHLEANQVAEALGALGVPQRGILFIENVGNLVCPAAFDLGEAARVVLVSLTEGDDKPLKYPDMFARADLVLITKIDLAPHLDADPAVLEARARRIKPGVETIRLSIKTGEGMEAWLAWITAARARLGAATG